MDSVQEWGCEEPVGPHEGGCLCWDSSQILVGATVGPHGREVGGEAGEEGRVCLHSQAQRDSTSLGGDTINSKESRQGTRWMATQGLICVSSTRRGKCHFLFFLFLFFSLSLRPFLILFGFVLSPLQFSPPPEITNSQTLRLQGQAGTPEAKPRGGECVPLESTGLKPSSGPPAGRRAGSALPDLPDLQRKLEMRIYVTPPHF